MKTRIGIIGAGPAGLMAAINAANSNAEITIIDKQNDIGGKIAVSGKGQCNFAHRSSYHNYLNCYGQHGRFLTHIFKTFFVDDAIAFFDGLDVPTVIEFNGKIFPKSKDAKQMINAFRNKLRQLSVNILLNTSVNNIINTEGGWQVTTNTDKFIFDYLIIATGGASFRHLGTTGDAIEWFNHLSLKTIPLKPALTGITSTSDHSQISGITLNNATVSCAGKRKTGELLITHKGYSGPLIHNMSRFIDQGSSLTINWVSLDSNELEKKILSTASLNGTQILRSFLVSLPFPAKLVNYLVPSKLQTTNLAELSKLDRKNTIVALTKHKVQNPQLIGFKSAMVTAGGLDLSEINRKTCQVKAYPNLYAIGETIDIDGDTGGYNIMAAMSMGVAAGRHLRKNIN